MAMAFIEMYKVFKHGQELDSPLHSTLVLSRFSYSTYYREFYWLYNRSQDRHFYVSKLLKLAYIVQNCSHETCTKFRAKTGKISWAGFRVLEFTTKTQVLVQNKKRAGRVRTWIRARAWAGRVRTTTKCRVRRIKKRNPQFSAQTGKISGAGFRVLESASKTQVRLQSNTKAC